MFSILNKKSKKKGEKEKWEKKGFSNNYLYDIFYLLIDIAVPTNQLPLLFLINKSTSELILSFKNFHFSLFIMSNDIECESFK